MDGIIRGVIMDKFKGNFLIIDENRKVIVGIKRWINFTLKTLYHGNKKQSDESIQIDYPEPIDFFGVTNYRYWCFSSFFELAYERNF